MNRAPTCFAVAVLILPAIVFAQPFDPIPSVDLAKLKPSDFSDDEIDLPAGGNNSNFAMPYLLAHFKTVADAVSDGSGTWPRGYIGITVWRGGKDNRPHNARIMENNLALAYFYVTDRPWNVYRGHTGVRQRLEAAFEFMMSEDGPRGPNGQFSEYEPKRYGLAPTAFLTKFLGQSLVLLHRPGAPQIDPDVLKRTVQMQRDAILFVLTDPAFYAHGKRFTNQYGNVWAGALAYLSIFPDDLELRDKLYAKFAASDADFQSPAGFFYEADGPDWSYNLNTHASNQRMARFYTRGGAHPMGGQFVEDERQFVEWLSYNAVPLPDWSGFVLNKGIETRSNYGFTRPIESTYADEVELARAFAPSGDEVARRRSALRAELERKWPNVAELPRGEFRAYAPYNFLHREHAPVHPTAAERDAARAKLPYFADTSFNHQRVDHRHEPNPTYTFVRRPTYYAAFNAGAQKNNQRLGLGLLWHPRMGALMQSQTGSLLHAWGTHAAGAAGAAGAAPAATKPATTAATQSAAVVEAQTLVATYRLGSEAVGPSVGARNLPDGDLVVSYPLGTRGRKEVRFLDDRIEVSVKHPGKIREQIPLLRLPDDQISTNESGVTLQRGGGGGGGTLQIEAATQAPPKVVDSGNDIGPYTVATAHLEAVDELRYTIRIQAP